MLNFNLLESNKESLRLQYLTAKPFPHIQLLDICDDNKLKDVFVDPRNYRGGLYQG